MGIECSTKFILAIIPALIANGAPVASRRFLAGRRLHPIDGGLVLPDGKRLLGDGKTVEGFLVAVTAGSVIALIESLITGDYTLLVAGVASSVGAMLGDIGGSFIKRRIGLERGAPAPLLDQLDFYLGAILFIRIAGIRFTLVELAVCAVIVVLLHASTNYIAYRLGLKDVPW